MLMFDELSTLSDETASTTALRSLFKGLDDRSVRMKQVHSTIRPIPHSYEAGPVRAGPP